LTAFLPMTSNSSRQQSFHFRILIFLQHSNPTSHYTTLSLQRYTFTMLPLQLHFFYQTQLYLIHCPFCSATSTLSYPINNLSIRFYHRHLPIHYHHRNCLGSISIHSHMRI
jgi:hypothetical protein